MRAFSDRAMRRTSLACLAACGLLFLIGNMLRPVDAQEASAGCAGAKPAYVANMAVAPAHSTQ